MAQKKGNKPIILITGAAGNIGTALAKDLKTDYTVIGLDVKTDKVCDKSVIFDITSRDSIDFALKQISKEYGKKIHAVIHLAAYFDFSGEDSPLYKKINEEGTTNLLIALQDFNVERFIYSSTMLVNEPGVPGQRIDEETFVKPGWAYPASKARTEEIIQEHHGDIPYTILRLAGLYDEETAVPTLSHQIARIYEKDFKSYLYAGRPGAGQAFIHRDDLVASVCKTVERAKTLPNDNIILIGEPDTESYEALQNRIGELIHGAEEWTTITFPKAIAKPGAWAEIKAEEMIPDALDEGQKPFIRPFMIDLASDHYELDISKAKELLDWQPQHSIYDSLPALIDNLKKDPAAWYRRNGIHLPEWMEVADEKGRNPDKLRQNYEENYSHAHYKFLWAQFANLFLAIWLLTAPFTLGYESQGMTISDVASGAALLLFGFMALSKNHGWARLACGAVGLWVLGAPLIFWAPTAAAYLNGTLVGMLIVGFATLTRPWPFMSKAAAMTGPDVPPGWDFSPSSWFQRLPVILLAVVGFFISRYLCAYQLGHIDGVWEPFFTGSPDNPKNGTEEIITSSVSEAWPVPDAGLGALTYALEILTGMIGSTRRWRTMPWLVMLFGFMIVPLGIISITFIIIQPIVIGTWCTLCLIAAAAMVIQIPYFLDELVATGEFLWRKHKAGRPWLKIFFTGDSDEVNRQDEDNFEQSPAAITKEILLGGVTFPWNLLACIVIGLWLMFTRLTLGVEGGMANADHLIGSLTITIAVIALAETARPVRFFIMPLGFALLITPFVYSASLSSLLSSLICAFALIGLSIRRGTITTNYGAWNRLIK
ncbi:MAG: vitamin K epoxide reductase family protein [Alphaproteobacteria bacterium]